MDETKAAELRKRLKEAREQLSDLTRNIDESPAIEHEEMMNSKIQRARERILELERALAELESST